MPTLPQYKKSKGFHEDIEQCGMLMRKGQLSLSITKSNEFHEAIAVMLHINEGRSINLQY